MKFFGTPYMAVTELNRNPKERANPFKRNVLIFRFDQNGEYETNDEKLIKKLKRKFKCEETKEIMPFEPETKIYKCKHCDFETENKGVLAAHYKKEHKKE